MCSASQRPVVDRRHRRRRSHESRASAPRSSGAPHAHRLRAELLDKAARMLPGLPRHPLAYERRFRGHPRRYRASSRTHAPTHQSPIRRRRCAGVLSALVLNRRESPHPGTLAQPPEENESDSALGIGGRKQHAHRTTLGRCRCGAALAEPTMSIAARTSSMRSSERRRTDVAIRQPPSPACRRPSNGRRKPIA